MLYAENNKLYDYNYINDFSLVKNYLEYCSIYKSETTINTYRSCLKTFYIFYAKYLKENNINCEEHLIKSIEQKTLETYINFLVNKKLSADTIHSRISVLKDYFKFLSKNKIVNGQKIFDIFEDLRLPKKIIKSQICRKSNEVIELLKKIKEGSDKNKFSMRRNILMILLMSNTGMRKKEIANINVNYIDFNDNTITIYKTKNSKPRIVGFSESVKNSLLEYLKERESILKNNNRESNRLLIKSAGGDLSLDMIGKIMQRLSKKYNFKITCHSLRRGFATDMAENKTDIYLISKMLGHANINTTASRYIQVFSNAIKEAMNNHPFSKLQTFSKEKETMQNSMNKNEILFTINLLSEEIKKLYEVLKKE